MKIAVLIARTLLGLVFLVFGLNFFFHFIPQPPPPTGKAGAFEGGLFGAGYFFPFMKVIESVGGLCLIINRFTALVVLILLPIIVNIFLFHSFLLPEGLPVALPIIIFEIFLIYAYRKYYIGLLTASPTL
jgi:putative oxidoreductase